MKARISANVLHCVRCNSAMLNRINPKFGFVIVCSNYDCPDADKEFAAPVIVLVEVKEGVK